jgi:hypothetical protein
MGLLKKSAYLIAAINISVNGIFAVPVVASINMTPPIIATVIHMENFGDVDGHLKYLIHNGGASPLRDTTAAPEGEHAKAGEYATGVGDDVEAAAIPKGGDAAGTGDAVEAGNATANGVATVAGDTAEADESIWYSPDIPMKKEHQKLLWECCKQKGLDYIDMLALISLESNFNEKCSNKRYKGYFQISTIHAESLVKALKTPNNPLDGAINIKWGTTLFSWILADKRLEGLEGKAKRDAALSIYQRGAGGYDKYGLNNNYLKKYYEKRDKIAACFEK